MKYRKESAFLLFEVLIAIFIASVVIVIIMHGLGNALKSGSVAALYFKARFLAESKMAMLEKQVVYKSETKRGKFTEGEDPEGIFSWEQRISPVAISRWGTQALPVNEARVIVSWDNRKVELVTYVTREEGTPEER